MSESRKLLKILFSSSRVAIIKSYSQNVMWFWCRFLEFSAKCNEYTLFLQTSLYIIRLALHTHKINAVDEESKRYLLHNSLDWLICYRYYGVCEQKAVQFTVLCPKCECLNIWMWFFLSLHRAFWYSHSSFTNKCTFIKTLITIYIKLDSSYMFRYMTIIRELAIGPG